MFQPIMDRVLVRRIEKSKTSPIEIPQQYQQQSDEGEVVALGQFVVMGGREYPLDDFLKVGDIVRFSEYNGEKVIDEGVEYVLLRIQDIRGRKMIRLHDTETGEIVTIPDSTGNSA